METKPAIYTTEFWVMVLGTVATILNQLGAWNFVSNWHSGIIWTALAAAYQVSRGFAKQGVGADPKLKANQKLIPRRKDFASRP